MLKLTLLPTVWTKYFKRYCHATSTHMALAIIKRSAYDWQSTARVRWLISAKIWYNFESGKPELAKKLFRTLSFNLYKSRQSF